VACARFSRAYVRHLFVSEEILGLRLLSLHNVHFLVSLMRDARAAVQAGTFDGWSRDWLARYHSNVSTPHDFVPSARSRILQAPGGQLTGMIFMYGAIFAIFYFVLIRPQQRQRKEHDALVKALKKGDEIVTAGGWWARSCTSPRRTAPALDDRITIKSGESRLIVERGRIARVARTAAGASTAEVGVSLLDIHVLGSPILRQETDAGHAVHARAASPRRRHVRHDARGQGDRARRAAGGAQRAPDRGRSRRHALALVNPEIISARGHSLGGGVPLHSRGVRRTWTAAHASRCARRISTATHRGRRPRTCSAVCLQHEIDHLHGKLFLDRLSLLKRRAALKAWEEEKVKYPKNLRVLPVGDLPPESDATGRRDRATPPR
jgi:preprotein translocase subunit YajC